MPILPQTFYWVLGIELYIKQTCCWPQGAYSLVEKGDRTEIGRKTIFNYILCSMKATHRKLWCGAMLKGHWILTQITLLGKPYFIIWYPQMRKMGYQHVQRAWKSVAIATQINKYGEKWHSALNKSKDVEVLLVASKKYAYHQWLWRSLLSFLCLFPHLRNKNVT